MLSPERVTRSTMRWVCRVRIHDALFIARQGYNSLHLMRRKTYRLCTVYERATKAGNLHQIFYLERM